ncbi:Fe-S cluster assembly ATPase SufC [Marinithermus hydrothermalis]|uniref:FeS assembly ATPase SufC n=1 Tax=Marinithermus hydrothermalis (strain DSM 14884 / JCM 11576 / T1) TaxID=869210 RepID=F2NKG6_MARHT|nr:Fe-S cluster assembly ATPase SufC [Marinithermus hydrothermalis]AEB12626.1 FeS assembly ATPase SufC [Marinithermus hydrothermalis DSM 14884]
MANQLEIRDLWVSIEGQPILKGVNLTVPKGEVHALMGPNGAGKSTLGKVIAGDPEYTVEQGEILLDGENILELEPDERARKGLFLAFQYPVEVPGVTIANFLRLALSAHKGGDVSVTEFYSRLQHALETLEWDESVVSRYLNEGFSGGEKKRNEILQLMVLQPKYAILDETDSGLDIDALKIVAKGVNAMRGPEFGALVITHYQRLLNYIVPDVVHVMVDGRVVKSGDKNLALELEQKGYDWIKELAAQS